MGKKKATRRRGRRKIGLGEVAVLAAAIAHVSGGRFLKNAVTDGIRNGTFWPVTRMTGDPITGAAITVVGYSLARIEANKMGVNPQFGPFRAF